jgi:hypothetical protein
MQTEANHFALTRQSGSPTLRFHVRLPHSRQNTSRFPKCFSCAHIHRFVCWPTLFHLDFYAHPGMDAALEEVFTLRQLRH